MSHTFTVTDSCVDGNSILVTINVTEDGGLIVGDYSAGPAADACFYPGANVDHELLIPPKSAQKLCRHIGIYGGDVRALAARLGLIYRDKTDALKLIKQQCDDLGLKYSEGRWP